MSQMAVSTKPCALTCAVPFRAILVVLLGVVAFVSGDVCFSVPGHSAQALKPMAAALLVLYTLVGSIVISNMRKQKSATKLWFYGLSTEIIVAFLLGTLVG